MMRYKITANAPVTCHGFGLDFVEGVAWTDDPAIAKDLKSRSYKVEDTKAAKPKPEK